MLTVINTQNLSPGVISFIAQNHQHPAPIHRFQRPLIQLPTTPLQHSVTIPLYSAPISFPPMLPPTQPIVQQPISLSLARQTTPTTNRQASKGFDPITYIPNASLGVLPPNFDCVKTVVTPTQTIQPHFSSHNSKREQHQQLCLQGNVKLDTAKSKNDFKNTNELYNDKKKQIIKDEQNNNFKTTDTLPAIQEHLENNNTSLESVHKNSPTPTLSNSVRNSEHTSRNDIDRTTNAISAVRINIEENNNHCLLEAENNSTWKIVSKIKIENDDCSDKERVQTDLLSQTVNTSNIESNRKRNNSGGEEYDCEAKVRKMTETKANIQLHGGDKLRHSIAAILSMGDSSICASNENSSADKNIDDKEMDTKFEENVEVDDNYSSDIFGGVSNSEDPMSSQRSIKSAINYKDGKYNVILRETNNHSDKECCDTIKEEMEEIQDNNVVCDKNTESVDDIEDDIYEDEIEVDDDNENNKYGSQFITHTETTRVDSSPCDCTKHGNKDHQDLQTFVEGTHSFGETKIHLNNSDDENVTCHLKKLEELVVQNDEHHFKKDEFFNAKSHVLQSPEFQKGVEVKNNRIIASKRENFENKNSTLNDRLSSDSKPNGIHCPVSSRCILPQTLRPCSHPHFHHLHSYIQQQQQQQQQHHLLKRTPPIPNTKSLQTHQDIHHYHNLNLFTQNEHPHSQSESSYQCDNTDENNNHNQQHSPKHSKQQERNQQQKHKDLNQQEENGPTKSAFKPVIKPSMSNTTPLPSFPQFFPSISKPNLLSPTQIIPDRISSFNTTNLKYSNTSEHQLNDLILSPHLPNFSQSQQLDAISLLRDQTPSLGDFPPDLSPPIINNNNHTTTTPFPSLFKNESPNAINSWLNIVRQRYYSNHVLKNNNANTIGQSVLACPEIPTTNLTPSKKSSHHHNNTAPRYHCESCNKTYSTFGGLSKHRQFHCLQHVKKDFGCKFCTKSYSSLGALKMHVRTHTLPCKCHVCGKAFSRPWLLQGHVRTHTGEKPFQCNQCGRSFADRSNLRAHLQTHAEIKKYACVKCGKTFSRMSLLNKHSDGSCPANVITCI